MLETPREAETEDRSGVFVLVERPSLERFRDGCAGSRAPRDELRSREGGISAGPPPLTMAFLRGVVRLELAASGEDESVRVAGLTVSSPSASCVFFPEVLWERRRLREGVLLSAALRVAELGTAGFLKVSSALESPAELASSLRTRPGVVGSRGSVVKGVRGGWFFPPACG